ncbi:anti-sigma factor RsiW [Filimonas zeae]|uniref:Uncharacterized protein n=1 Tax=Filimonas zeae TaxID=1737353 RepID=A0A917J1T1_9BACT|nr:hypothetical protein [Filimonas zeae]MDR6341089.1 anti-sigma factor RsiW [Filimonas zeae]GGH77272.1 hypothetical protein GCM10011379_43370 [Filimonas zeae]
MLINRHNYEEYFLMYVDNELNMHQRIEVELFVEQHPDLAGELTALQEAVLLPEPDITFQHKNSLFKQEKEGLTKENCEAQFLLYIDNELTEEARRKVEAFVQQHPEQQTQLTQLQQAVLTPEPVVFANKKILYRKEKERRVITLAWSRLAIAAALLGVTATAGWWFMRNDAPGHNPVAVVADTPAQGSNRPGQVPGNQTHTGSATITEQLAKAQQQANKPSTPSNGADNHTATTDKTTVPVTGENYIAAAPAHNHTAVKNNTATIPANANTARPVSTDLSTLQAGNETAIAYQPPTQVTVTADIAAVKTDIPPAATTKPTAARLTIINEPNKTIAYKELDTSEDDQSLYVGSLELNRNKVKGILRKAGRMLGAKAKAVTEENL